MALHITAIQALDEFEEQTPERASSVSSFQKPDAPRLDPQALAALRAQGVERLKANAFADAIELLSRALVAEPQDAPTQFQLGVALQGAGLHEQALKCFAAAQKSMPDDPAPFLHAAIAFINLDKLNDALWAASEACHRAPQHAQAHYVYGQAWLRLNEPAKAERALAEAVRLAPAWPDAWVEYGIARYRQGAIEDAKTAMRQALVFKAGLQQAHPAWPRIDAVSGR